MAPIYNHIRCFAAPEDHLPTTQEVQTQNTFSKRIVGLSVQLFFTACILCLFSFNSVIAEFGRNHPWLGISSIILASQPLIFLKRCSCDEDQSFLHDSSIPYLGAMSYGLGTAISFIPQDEASLIIQIIWLTACALGSSAIDKESDPKIEVYVLSTVFCVSGR